MYMHMHVCIYRCMCVDVGVYVCVYHMRVCVDVYMCVDLDRGVCVYLCGYVYL